MTDRNKLCREFTELTGGHWHELKHLSGYEYVCNCGAAFNVFDPRCVEMTISQHNSKNHTYFNPADVLKKIIEIGLYDEFMVQYGGLSKFGRHLDCILVDLILEPDALLKSAVEFLKEGKK